MHEPLHVAVVYGSAREGRLCDTVAGWLRAHLADEPGLRVTTIDPRDGTAGLHGRLADADAFIVVVPEYNHGYPAPLKELLDAAKTEWRGKAAAFVSYGGKSGGIRAVEQLRQVFAELHVATVRDGVAFVDAWDRFDADGRLDDVDGGARALRTMLSQLKWWARALRAARRAYPYTEIA